MSEVFPCANPNCRKPVATLGHRHITGGTELQTCPSCGVRLERPVLPGEPWRLAEAADE